MIGMRDHDGVTQEKGKRSHMKESKHFKIRNVSRPSHEFPPISRRATHTRANRLHSPSLAHSLIHSNSPPFPRKQASPRTILTALPYNIEILSIHLSIYLIIYPRPHKTGPNVSPSKANIDPKKKEKEEQEQEQEEEQERQRFNLISFLFWSG